MSKILKNILLFAIVLFPAAIHSREPELQDNIHSARHYHCEIISNYISLRNITDEFGEILLSENYDDIFQTSVFVIESLDEMKRELESMDVPEEMRKAYYTYLKSIESYRQGADLIRVAIGTYLGEYERNETDIQELIDLSVHYVTMANEYLGQSLALHGELFESHAQRPDDCKKIVAGNY